MANNQEQHLTPQVYLKQWSSEDLVTILDAQKGIIEMVPVAAYNKKLNYYDINWNDDDLSRHNENEFCRLENEYQNFLNTIKAQKGIRELKWQAYCDRLVALMFVRTESYWNAFNELLSVPITREKLLNEIYSESPHKNMIKLVLQFFSDTPPMNLLLCDIAGYIQNRLKSFNQIVLKAPVGRLFPTSANPVVVIPNSSDSGTFFHWTSEIYLPLSPEYCLYMFHPEFVQGENNLQNFKSERITEVSPKFVWDFATKLSLYSGSWSFVLPFGIEPCAMQKMSQEELNELDLEYGGFFQLEETDSTSY